MTTFKGGQRRGQKGEWEGAGGEERQGRHRNPEESGARRRADCADCFPEAVQDGN